MSLSFSQTNYSQTEAPRVPFKRIHLDFEKALSTMITPSPHAGSLFLICLRAALSAHAGSLISAGPMQKLPHCPAVNNDKQTQCGCIQTRMCGRINDN